MVRFRAELRIVPVPTGDGKYIGVVSFFGRHVCPVIFWMISHSLAAKRMNSGNCDAVMLTMAIPQYIYRRGEDYLAANVPQLKDSVWIWLFDNSLNFVYLLL